MILLVFLRLLFILKASLQAIGFCLAFYAFYNLAWDYYQNPVWFHPIRGFTKSYAALALLLIPEAATWVLLWVCGGASEVYRRNHPKQADHEIPIFSKQLLVISFWTILVLICVVSGIIGSLFEMTVLGLGVSIVLCIVGFKMVKSLFINFLDIKV